MTVHFRSVRRVAHFLATVVVVAGIAACRREDSPLLHVEDAELATPAPDSFRVAFETSRGSFAVVARRAWAPRGADRFYHLTKRGYYDSTYFFRVVESFVAQFGMPGDPKVYAAWRDRRIDDDSVRHGNTRGTLSFASQGPNTRSVQLFINLKDNPRLDTFGGGFAPIGEVVEGMSVVDSLYDGYGEGAPRGLGPRQDMIAAQGNDYLRRHFEKLDFIRRAAVVREWP
jgi:peptidyl-prolyl cis-trans isomerase A (cyclophilin A)